jgi:hypothetical protein
MSFNLNLARHHRLVDVTEAASHAAPGKTQACRLSEQRYCVPFHDLYEVEIDLMHPRTGRSGDHHSGSKALLRRHINMQRRELRERDVARTRVSEHGSQLYEALYIRVETGPHVSARVDGNDQRALGEPGLSPKGLAPEHS